ncbi:MAG: hypothetical protein L3J43_04875 [Sulfurovum sp.]|nr:hypothetical protein [Sulfurovum sp.]
MKIATILTIATLALIGCGGGGDGTPVSSPYSPTDPNAHKRPTVDVKYTLNGSKRPTCHNADDIGTLNPDNSDFIDCTWQCGRYGGIKGRNGDTIYISLWFRKSERTDEGVWELTDEFTQEASPGVCRDI